MIKKKLNIVSIASEVYPFSKSGGLADVVSSLPKALKELGHQSIVITPFYEKLISKNKYKFKIVKEDFIIKVDIKNKIKVNILETEFQDMKIFFIENKKYFGSKKKIYYGKSREDNIRFLIFNLACLELLILLKQKIDIIHCHDWQTGLIPFFLKKKNKYKKYFKKTKTLFTIHNIIFQMGGNWWEVPKEKKDKGQNSLPLISNKNIQYINFTRRGIIYADAISTVSKKYKEEIMTKNFGQNLEKLLKNREDKLFGIINGIDFHSYNPINDLGIKKKYNLKTLDLKEENKIYLQKKLGLPIRKNIPIITSTSRISYEKGFELLFKILKELLYFNIQFVFMGDGNKDYINILKRLQKKYPKKIIWIPFDQKIETLIYAGSDFLILPSNHEPCGLNPIIAMRYGCVPIVRKIGGLEDNIINFDFSKNNYGTGFTFSRENKYSLFTAIIRALEIYKNKNTWVKLQKRTMKISNSWDIPAKKYIKLYKKIINNN